MRILVSNDDGIGAAGLQPLADALAALGEVWVVAPLHEQSACSLSLTMRRPLRVDRQGPRRFAVDGTPADCVYLAVHHLLPARPDLVVSGINRGANLGCDVHYSGTVGAAMEASFAGLRALAVSLYVDWKTPPERHHWGTAADLAIQVARLMLDRPVRPLGLWNLNVPDRPAAEVPGIRLAALGRRHYDPLVDVRRDPRGRTYYWIGGDHRAFDPTPGTDGPAIEAGWATLTPLHLDLTDREELEDLAGLVQPAEGLDLRRGGPGSTA